MSNPTSTVEVTLRLPKEVYDRAAQVAAREQQRLEDILAASVADGLDAYATTREIFERLSDEYRARLATEGRLDQTDEEILEELRVIREQVAREFYP